MHDVAYLSPDNLISMNSASTLATTRARPLRAGTHENHYIARIRGRSFFFANRGMGAALCQKHLHPEMLCCRLLLMTSFFLHGEGFRRRVRAARPEPQA